MKNLSSSTVYIPDIPEVSDILRSGSSMATHIRSGSKRASSCPCAHTKKGCGWVATRVCGGGCCGSR